MAYTTQGLFTNQTGLTSFAGTDPKTFDKAKLYASAQVAEHGITPITTLGSGSNEITGHYKWDDGAHHLRIFNKISPDILLVHQSKMVAFYRMAGTRDKLNSVDRAIKLRLLRDNNIPLHRLTTTTVAEPWVDKSEHSEDNPSWKMATEEGFKQFFSGYVGL